MNWRSEWAAIAARIDGLMSAGQLFVGTLAVNSADSYNVTDRHLGKEAREITAALAAFIQAHRGAIAREAEVTIVSFLENYAAAINDSSVKGIDGLKLRITSLAAMRSAVDYHLSDLQSVMHKRAERAFLHLRQTIVADEVVRERWQRAFGSGELACEKLGAAHLMLHGIWGFKVSAEGGRTDLVFGPPVNDGGSVAATADALVLTEWKLIRVNQDTNGIAAAARVQASLYATGLLGGIELSQYRYIVLVSEAQLEAAADIHEGSVVYRHVNVPVNPQVPSKAARRTL